ncbi:hypothetical protein T484DRAFT_1741920 [Baffinella frigidus]|nr:hypothetical protein T484DRAFT_1741920 [Cryptophyta sp. CCMP2293]
MVGGRGFLCASLALAGLQIAACFTSPPNAGAAPALALRSRWAGACVLSKHESSLVGARRNANAGRGAARLGGLGMKVRDDWGRFEDWAKEAGIEWAKNSLAEFKGGLRGVKATRAIAEGDVRNRTLSMRPLNAAH